jgi:hypothetical protein
VAEQLQSAPAPTVWRSTFRTSTSEAGGSHLLGEHYVSAEGVRYGVLVRLAIVVAVSMGLVVYGYHNASTNGPLATSFAYFWAGMVLLFVFLYYDATRRTSRGYPELNVVVAAIASAMPRIIRSPTNFYMNDEFGHVLQAGRMYETGKLFLSNPIIQEAKSYPGLETLAVGLENATHLPLVAIGLPLIVLWHVASVTGVYHLARITTADARIAFGAGLIYAMNPQMGQLDSWFAYEAFAVPLCIWALVFLLSAQQAEVGQRRRLWILAGLCAAACVVTHHISGGVLILGYVLIALGHSRKGRRSGGLVPVVAAVLVGLAFLAWVEWRGAHLEQYFGPYFSDGYHSVLGKITGKTYGSGPGSRTPFGGATSIPSYERFATYLSEVLLLAATVLVAIWWRKRILVGQVLVIGFALMYFALLPLLVSAQGQQIAHRSWAFSYIGLSIVIAVAGKEVALRARDAGRRYSRHLSGLTIRVGGSLAVIVLLLGGYGAGVNYLDQFPGPFVFQSDGRDVSHELVGVANWVNDNGGHNANFAADYRSSVLIAATTLGNPEPLLALEVIQPALVPAEVVVTARKTLRFVIIDKRLTSARTEGNDFVPTLVSPSGPLPPNSVAKLATFPWLHLVHQTPHYLVYAVVGLK